MFFFTLTIMDKCFGEMNYSLMCKCLRYKTGLLYLNALKFTWYETKKKKTFLIPVMRKLKMNN